MNQSTSVSWDAEPWEEKTVVEERPAAVPFRKQYGFIAPLRNDMLSESFPEADVSVTAKEFYLSRGFCITEAKANEILGHPAPNFRMQKALNTCPQTVLSPHN
jgi:hypothetical protein